MWGRNTAGASQRNTANRDRGLAVPPWQISGIISTAHVTHRLGFFPGDFATACERGYGRIEAAPFGIWPPGVRLWDILVPAARPKRETLSPGAGAVRVSGYTPALTSVHTPASGK
jgi:hypothetical protein